MGQRFDIQEWQEMWHTGIQGVYNTREILIYTTTTKTDSTENLLKLRPQTKKVMQR